MPRSRIEERICRRIWKTWISKKDKGEKFCRIPQLRRNANELRDMFLCIEDGASDGCVQREASVSR